MLAHPLIFHTDVNAQDDESQGPLYEACNAGNAEGAKILLQHNADIDDDENVFGRTALHAAIFARSPETVRLLIEKGANLQLKNTSGQDALYQAIVVGDLDVFNDILDALEKTDKLQEALQLQESLDNRTSLHCAVINNDKEMTEFLLQRAPTVATVIDIKDRQGDTALHTAAGASTAANVEELLNAHADPRLKNSKQETAVDILVEKYILTLGQDQNIQQSMREMLELLLKKAPDAAQNPKGLLLADIHCGENNTICEILKDHREDKDEHEWSLLALAQHLKRKDKVDQFLKDVKEDPSPKPSGLQPTTLRREPVGNYKTVSDMIKLSENKLELSTETDDASADHLPVAADIGISTLFQLLPCSCQTFSY